MRTDAGGDEPDRELEPLGAPSEYAEAAEAPRWIQAAAKFLACLPLAVSTLGALLLVALAVVLCLIVAAMLVF